MLSAEKELVKLEIFTGTMKIIHIYDTKKHPERHNSVAAIEIAHVNYHPRKRVCPANILVFFQEILKTVKPVNSVNVWWLSLVASNW
jgi:hypothetical protein